MTETVDRDALRTKLEGAAAGREGSGVWDNGWRAGMYVAIAHLAEMPTVEVPRGWRRDDLLAAMDAVPGTVVERLDGVGGWYYTLPRTWIERWPDDVVSYDVRVVPPVPPATEDVPLHEVVGRKLPDRDGEILSYFGDDVGVYVRFSTGHVLVSLNADGTVTVAAREA